MALNSKTNDSKATLGTSGGNYKTLAMPSFTNGDASGSFDIQPRMAVNGAQSMLESKGMSILGQTKGM